MEHPICGIFTTVLLGFLHHAIDLALRQATFLLEDRGDLAIGGTKNPSQIDMKTRETGWWLGHPSEKYYIVNWDD